MTPIVLLLALGCIPELVAPVLVDNPDHDYDGDGVTENEGDCDDLRDAVSSNVTESCDGVDNDCDGEVDGIGAIDRTVWFADADGDGFGSGTDAVKTCEQPDGYVADSSDCDDTDATINPESIWYEDADGDGYGNSDRSFAQCHPPNGYVNNSDDCDDTDPQSLPGAVWYADTDGDGFGDASSTQQACSQPSGYVSDDADCDDADASATTSDAVWYADTDGDGFGDAGNTTAACTAPADHVGNADDCDDTDTEAFDPDRLWYADTDGDGAGDAANTTMACTQPLGFVGNSDDCDDTDGSIVDPDASWFEDADSDGFGNPAVSVAACMQPTGFVDNSDDCDDADGALRPDALWYADTDTDTYGDPTVMLTQCTQPSGHVANNLDCDDTDSTRNPDTIWYDDTDADGWGDDATTTTQCEAVSNSVLTGGDCDASDGTVNPDGTEVCGDGLDNDCAGGDEYCITTALADELAWATWSGETSGDRFGAALALVDSTHLAVGAPAHGTDAGRVYVLPAPAGAGPITASSDAAFTLSGGSASEAGTAIASYEFGSVASTGLVVAAPGTAGTGSVMLWDDLLATGDQPLSGSAATLIGVAGGRLGHAVLVMDANTDGVPDIVASDISTSRGYVYVTNAPYTGSRAVDSEGDSLFGPVDAKVGTSLASEDLTGDGSANDLLIGAPGLDRAYLAPNPFGPSNLNASATTVISGPSGSETGASLVIVDVDGDTVPDALVGAPSVATPGGMGVVYLVLGPLEGRGLVTVPIGADAVFSGPVDGAGGAAVASVPDIDGDTVAELLIGAPLAGATGEEGGRMWLLQSGNSGTSGDLDATSIALSSITPGDELGATLSLAPAVDDGLPDFAIGAPGADSVYLFAGATLRE